MASRKPVKKYALDLISEIRKDTENVRSQSLPAIDLAEVIQVTPDIIIEPMHEDAEYEEEYLMFKINPDSLKLGDTVVIGRDPSHQPIILGIADYENEDPFLNEELASFKSDTEWLRENTQHWRASVNDAADLPTGDNVDGDLRFAKSSNTIYRWDGEGNIWVAASGASGNFVPTAGGNMTGDLIMDPGTMITLNDLPIVGTDAVNKAYVDYVFGLCCSPGPPAGPPPPIPTITIDATDSTPCYAALVTDQVILVDTSLGPVTVCLPASHIDTKVYEVKDISGDASTNNITIISDDGDSIDNISSFVITVDYQAVTLISDGSDWFIY